MKIIQIIVARKRKRKRKRKKEKISEWQHLFFLDDETKGPSFALCVGNVAREQKKKEAFRDQLDLLI